MIRLYSMNYIEKGVIISSLDEISSTEELIYHRKDDWAITPKACFGHLPSILYGYYKSRNGYSILR